MYVCVCVCRHVCACVCVCIVRGGRSGLGKLELIFLSVWFIDSYYCYMDNFQTDHFLKIKTNVLALWKEAFQITASLAVSHQDNKIPICLSVPRWILGTHSELPVSFCLCFILNNNLRHPECTFKSPGIYLLYCLKKFLKSYFWTFEQRLEPLFKKILVQDSYL